MAVKEILDDRVIDLNMNAKNKDEVIRHLAGLLKNAGYIENLEGYVRERLDTLIACKQMN